ncbi:MAG: hypothetical protein KDA69_15460, partial [Planctomycetaceae bacterium]|nr:hypothetical protein [Planctomycetaceae bacterium]
GTSRRCPHGMEPNFVCQLRWILSRISNYGKPFSLLDRARTNSHRNPHKLLTILPRWRAILQSRVT